MSFGPSAALGDRIESSKYRDRRRYRYRSRYRNSTCYMALKHVSVSIPMPNPIPIPNGLKQCGGSASRKGCQINLFVDAG